MPQFRAYPEATSLEPTDAFVLDRIGAGTKFIEAQNFIGASAGVLIYAVLPTGPTDGWAPTGYVTGVDAIVITTVSGGSELQGLTGGVSDRRVVLANTDVDVLLLDHMASGTPAYNLICPNDTQMTVPVDGAVILIYDAGAPGWRVIGDFLSQTAAVAVAFKFSAGD